VHAMYNTFRILNKHKYISYCSVEQLETVKTENGNEKCEMEAVKYWCTFILSKTFD